MTRPFPARDCTVTVEKERQMDRLAISLLGPFAVTLDGEPVAWSGGDATRALLAYLVLHAGSECRREVLAGLLWPDDLEAVALQNLRQALHRLRRSIGDLGNGRQADRSFLRATRQTISFDPTSDYWLDVAALTDAIAVSRAHPHRQLERCTSCARRLEEAAEVYRGEFLAGSSFPSALFEEWMVVQREGLHGQALEMLGHLAAYHEGRGNYAQAIRYARRQTELEPWREEAHRQWMRALTFSGQRGAALAQYEACRRVLQDELSVEPDEETTALYERIRDGSELRPLFPPTPHNLPAQTTPFVGREAQLTEVRALLARPEVRLLTLTGAGGTGKTRLALQVAADLLDDYPDGVFFVALAPIRDPALVVPTMAKTLGLREAVAADVGAAQRAPLLESLCYYLRDRQLLLVVDNFEHVLSAAPALNDLLAAAPQVDVLVTSRAALHIYGEHEYSVPPMVTPSPQDLPPLERLAQVEAVRLFLQRARAARAGFALDEQNAAAVSEICSRLDGLPLALELAAARIKLLPPQAMLARLDSRLQFLTGGARDLPARQRTLRATIDWSYDLLDDDERTFFRRLSVFAGGFTMEAARAVALLPSNHTSSRPSVLDILEALVDQNLIQVSLVRGAPRFTMLETIREYALERLSESGEAEGEAVHRQHAAYFLALSEEAQPVLYRYGAEQAAWVDRLEMEQDNLRAALAWSIDRAIDVGLQLAGTLGRFWEVRATHREGRDWLGRALAKSVDCGSELKPLRARALNWAGTLAAYQEPAMATSLQRESLALWQEVGDQRGIARTLYDLGGALWVQGDSAQARPLMEEGIALLRQIGERLHLSRALFWYAGLTCAQGDFATARSSAKESVSLSREIGAIGHMASAIRAVGRVAHAQGDYATAQPHYEENLRLAREAKDTIAVVVVLEDLGSLAYDQRDYERARELEEESLGIWREMGNRRMVAFVLRRLGEIARLLGDYERAAVLYAEYLALVREMDDRWLTVVAILDLGYVALHRGDTRQAVACFEDGVALVQELGHPLLIAACLGLAGAIAAGEARQLDRAACLMGAAEALLEAADEGLSGVYQAECDRTVATLRAQLDAAAFKAAWAEGRRLAVDGGQQVGDWRGWVSPWGM